MIYLYVLFLVFSDSKSVASIVGDLEIIEQAMTNLIIQDDDILCDSE